MPLVKCFFTRGGRSWPVTVTSFYSGILESKVTLRSEVGLVASVSATISFWADMDGVSSCCFAALECLEGDKEAALLDFLGE